jgi:hypothetical protein
VSIAETWQRPKNDLEPTLPMAALALLIRPTRTGWGVYLSNGHELIRYRGLGSKRLALRYLRHYTQSLVKPPRANPIGWRRQADPWPST